MRRRALMRARLRQANRERAPPLLRTHEALMQNEIQDHVAVHAGCRAHAAYARKVGCGLRPARAVRVATCESYCVESRHTLCLHHMWTHS